MFGPLAAALKLGAAVREIEAELMLERQAAPKPVDLLLGEIDRALQPGRETEPIGRLDCRLHPLAVMLLHALLEATQALSWGEGLDLIRVRVGVLGFGARVSARGLTFRLGLGVKGESEG